MTTFKKICRWCLTEIEMSDHENGRWLPYNITNGLFHDCPKKPIRRIELN